MLVSAVTTQKINGANRYSGINKNSFCCGCKGWWGRQFLVTTINAAIGNQHPTHIMKKTMTVNSPGRFPNFNEVIEEIDKNTTDFLSL